MKGDIKQKQNKVEDDEQLERLQRELEELKISFERSNDQLKRAVADYHNLEKRVHEGRSELSSWASAELIKRILPTLDHLEKALEGSNEQDRASGWFKGVEMSVKQLKQTLKEEGLEEIPIESGFDPALHEAVDIRDGEENRILEVVEKGYNLNGKVLRPAKVVVGRSLK